MASCTARDTLAVPLQGGVRGSAIMHKDGDVMPSGIRGCWRVQLSEKRRGARKVRGRLTLPVLPSLALAFAAMIALLVMSGCHRGTGRYFEVVSFANLSPEKLLSQIESDQGLVFDETSVVWEGKPGESPFDGEVAVSVYDSHDAAVGPTQLREGFELGGVLVDWRCARFDDAGAADIAHAVMKACLLSDPIIDQSDHFMSWVSAGKCKVGGQDAFWYVIVYSSNAADDGGSEAQVYVGVETFEAARISSYDELPTYFGFE